MPPDSVEQFMAYEPKTHGRSKDLAKEFNLWSTAGEIGLKLAIPLLFFMLIGIKLDKMAHSTPLFMLLGIGLAFSASIIMIGRLIQKINRKDVNEN